jgi:CRISPR-associated protein Cas1
MPLDLHTLPKFRDGWGYLYVEHCRVEQEAKAIAVFDAGGRVPVPCAALAVLMLGPGTNITHAAVHALAENGCLVLWCGEGGVRFYGLGIGETRRADNLYHQAQMWAEPTKHMMVVRRLYEMRFPTKLPPGLTLRQIRGMEGVRVREAYARFGRETGVKWAGRSYRRDKWEAADPVNRALSAANSCLYGLCHAGILSAGFSPALGFIHTGLQTSFVFDIADLYKADMTVPAAFRAAAESEEDLERGVRLKCRDLFTETRLLERIIPDIEYALFFEKKKRPPKPDADGAVVPAGELWNPGGELEAGVNYAEEGKNDGRDNAGESPDEFAGGADAVVLGSEDGDVRGPGLGDGPG